MNRFQQVQGPNFGAALSASQGAGRSISQGLATIGSGLTKLGDRRNARVAAATKLQQDQALESRKLLAFQADEAGLQQLAQSSSPVPGLAEYLGARQKSLLDNAGTAAKTRGTDATTAGTEATTAGTLIDNTAAQFEQDGAASSRAVEAKVSQLGFKAEAAAADGNITAANQYRDEAIRISGGATGDGADTVRNIIGNALQQGKEGQTNRTAVAQDTTAIAQGNEDLYNSRGTNTDNNRRRDFEFGVDARDDRTNQDNIAQTNIEKALSAQLISDNASLDDSFAELSANPNVNPETRVNVANLLQNAVNTTPGLHQNVNPVDPFAVKFGDAQNNTSFGIDPDTGQPVIPQSAGSAQEQVTGLIGSTNRTLTGNRDYQQFLETKSLNDSATDSGGRINVGQEIRKAFPDVRFTDEHERSIRNTAKTLGASDAQIMSAISENTRTSGFFEGALPGGKSPNETFVDVSRVKDSLKRQIAFKDSDKQRELTELTERTGKAEEALSVIDKLSREVSSLEAVIARDPNSPAARAADKTLSKKADQMRTKRLLIDELSRKGLVDEDNTSRPEVSSFGGHVRQTRK